MTLKKVRKSFGKGVVISVLALSFLFQSCQAQLDSEVQMNPNTCNKFSERNSFRECIQEMFPIGSEFYKLEQFLIQQGFTKTVDKPEEEDFFFVFSWSYSISLKNSRIAVGGKYDQQSRIVELVVP